MRGMKTPENETLDMLMRGMLNVYACADEIGLRVDALYSLLSGRSVIVAEQAKALAEWSGATPLAVFDAFGKCVAKRQAEEQHRIEIGDFRANVNAGRRRKAMPEAKSSARSRRRGTVRA
jgi:hypothetical protein